MCEITLQAGKILPAMFSVWLYRKHPERRYRVVGIANVAHQSDDHPITIVYATLDHPERLWTRTLGEFLESFAPVSTLEMNITLLEHIRARLREASDYPDRVINDEEAEHMADVMDSFIKRNGND